MDEVGTDLIKWNAGSIQTPCTGLSQIALHIYTDMFAGE